MELTIGQVIHPKQRPNKVFIYLGPATEKDLIPHKPYNIITKYPEPLYKILNPDGNIIYQSRNEIRMYYDVVD